MASWLLTSKRRRSPCGERGLKCGGNTHANRFYVSLPVRGAWVEMPALRCRSAPCPSLPVRGAWVEIYCSDGVSVCRRSRSPCGERGLKFAFCDFSPAQARRSPCGERGLKSAAPAARLSAGGRSPCGERGLKWHWFRRPYYYTLRRSPCGERGLKCRYLGRVYARSAVAPRAGSVG